MLRWPPSAAVSATAGPAARSATGWPASIQARESSVCAGSSARKVCTPAATQVCAARRCSAAVSRVGEVRGPHTGSVRSHQSSVLGACGDARGPLGVEEVVVGAHQQDAAAQRRVVGGQQRGRVDVPLALEVADVAVAVAEEHLGRQVRRGLPAEVRGSEQHLPEQAVRRVRRRVDRRLVDALAAAAVADQHDAVEVEPPAPLRGRRDRSTSRRAARGGGAPGCRGRARRRRPSCRPGRSRRWRRCSPRRSPGWPAAAAGTCSPGSSGPAARSGRTARSRGRAARSRRCDDRAGRPRAARARPRRAARRDRAPPSGRRRSATAGRERCSRTRSTCGAPGGPGPCRA